MGKELNEKSFLREINARLEEFLRNNSFIFLN
jgi:hypothetical protein